MQLSVVLHVLEAKEKKKKKSVLFLTWHELMTAERKESSWADKHAVEGLLCFAVEQKEVFYMDVRLKVMRKYENASPQLLANHPSTAVS